jgi:hypothetical protein
MLVLLLLAASPACKHETPIEPGDELFGILEEAVLEVSLRAPTKRVSAQRRKPSQAFSYIFEAAKGTNRQRCAATPDLARATAFTFEVRVRGVVEAEQAKAFSASHKHGWTTLVVRGDMVDEEPFRLDLLRDPKWGEQAYARHPLDARLFMVDSKLMHLLDLDCESK